MNRLTKIVLTIVVAFLVIAGCFMFYLTRGLNEGESIELIGVNLNKISNGEYTGSYKFGRWNNEIKVTVDNNRITEINIIKDVTIPKPEVNQELFKRVINEQTTLVDSVVGATVTSKAYLKSIENALNETAQK